MKGKISFDYDGVFSCLRYRWLAKWYLDQGFEVYITTARFNEDKLNNQNYPGYDFTPNSLVLQHSNEVGIPEKNIRFCGYNAKWNYLKDFIMHYDDQLKQIESIDNHLPKCLTIWVNPEH